jgi:hypothetical protein
MGVLTYKGTLYVEPLRGRRLYLETLRTKKRFVETARSRKLKPLR